MYKMTHLKTILSEVKRHQIQMMDDRGYLIPDHERKMLKMEPYDLYVATLAYTKLDYTYSKEDDPSSKMGVFYRTKGNIYVQVEAIQDLLEKMHAGLKSMLLILNGKLSPTARAYLDRMITCKMQVWMESDLYVNPTKHCMTPKHRLLTREEEDRVIRGLVKTSNPITSEERTLGKSKLSKLPYSDIIRKWYGFPQGSIIAVLCDYLMLCGAEQFAPKYRVVN